MIRVEVEDDEAMTTTHRLLSPQEWVTVSGVELAALLWPNPTPSEITLVTEYLGKYRNHARQHDISA
jgi:hypothetical protein